MLGLALVCVSAHVIYYCVCVCVRVCVCVCVHVCARTRMHVCDQIP